MCHALPEAPRGGKRIEVKIVVIGIGQSLGGDDAAGLEAVRAWQQDHADGACIPGVRVEFVEAPGMELVTVLNGADAALLVDAVQSGAEAGRLHRLGEGDIAAMELTFGSMHGWGIPEALRLARALGFCPERKHLRLVGIEAAEMGLGEPLSAPVRTVIPAAAAAIHEEIRTFLGE
jgi:hydrogenase maturation protease